MEAEEIGNQIFGRRYDDSKISIYDWRKIKTKENYIFNNNKTYYLLLWYWKGYI